MKRNGSDGRNGVRSDLGPFAIVPEWILDADVSDRALRLYAVLGRYANENRQSFPSRRTLAARLRCSVKTVDRTLSELEQAGALTVERRRDEEGDNATNLYTLRFAPPGVIDDAPGRVTDDAPGGDTDDAQNESQVEREPDEREQTLPPATVSAVGATYDPLKGARIAGRDLPWDALAEETEATGEIHGSRMKRALASIRAEAWNDVRPTLQDPEFWIAMNWEHYERQLAEEIHMRARKLHADGPNLTYGPEGIARNWAKGGRLLRTTKDVAAAAAEGLRRGRAA